MRPKLADVPVPAPLLDELDECVAEVALCEQIRDAARGMLADAYRRLDAARFAEIDAQRAVNAYVAEHQPDVLR